jgi:hypothetical protein
MDRITYLNFDLLIDCLDAGYRARVLDSPAGQAAGDFSLPFVTTGGRDLEALDMEAAKDFGRRLFEAVFGGQVGSCLRRSLDEADREGAGLRIRLRLTEVPELAHLPWEYLYDPALDRFPVLSAETPLVRYLDLPERIRPLAIEPPLRMLVMISSPSDLMPLDVEQEWSTLNEALGHLERQGLVTLELLEDASLLALQRQLRRGEYHIFHFIGHGTFDEVDQDGALVLEDEDGRGRPVSGHELGTLLHDHRPLRLAFLNACEGARASRTDPFAGTAQGLVQQGIPAVVAMQFEISDVAAITLVREFYTALAEGFPVDTNLAEARKAVFAVGDAVEWSTPVLYMRSPDGYIFEVGEKMRSSPDRVTEGLGALTELMQSPEVRAAVIAFHTDFEAACEQIEILSDHKYLHDLLHTLQFHCYHPIFQEAKRFPDDDMAIDNLMDYELTLQGILDDLQAASERPSFASLDTSWIGNIELAHQELRQALEDLDATLLRRATWHMNRVLAVQPSQINTRLNASARALRLPALVEALSYICESICDSLTHLDLDTEKVDQFRAGVGVLAGLAQNLIALVQGHDGWQVVDLELRRIETAMQQDMMELEMSWPALKAMTEPLYDSVDDEWARSLQADALALDDALAQGDLAKTRRHFWRFRRRAGDRFFRVDTDLKELSGDLRQIGEPLTTIMSMIG